MAVFIVAVWIAGAVAFQYQFATDGSVGHVIFPASMLGVIAVPSLTTAPIVLADSAIVRVKSFIAAGGRLDPVRFRGPKSIAGLNCRCLSAR